jgi:hypothetical protein
MVMQVPPEKVTYRYEDRFIVPAIAARDELVNEQDA